MLCLKGFGGSPGALFKGVWGVMFERRIVRVDHRLYHGTPFGRPNKPASVSFFFNYYFFFVAGLPDRRTSRKILRNFIGFFY